MINRLNSAKPYIAFIFSLTLIGCSSTALQSPKDNNQNSFINASEANQQLEQVLPCCDSITKLEYQPLNDDEAQYISFDKDTNAYAFDSGKSFYKAYKLDENITELTVTVSGLFYNTVFSPQVLMLDSQFKQTRLISADKFNYKEAKLLNGDELTAQFSINRPNLNNPANETYFIIYTTEQAMLGATTVTHPAKLDARARSNVEPDIADPIIDHSAMGVVKLTFDMVNKDDSYVAKEPQATAEVDAKDMMTEAQYNQQIVTAVTDGEIETALQLVDQAEAAGSKSARSTFVEAIKK